MITERRNDLRHTSRQRKHLRPIFFTGTIHDHPLDSGISQRADDLITVRREPFVLQMIVRVEEFHPARRSRPSYRFVNSHSSAIDGNHAMKRTRKFIARRWKPLLASFLIATTIFKLS